MARASEATRMAIAVSIACKHSGPEIPSGRKRLTRDCVISVTDSGPLVGVYWEGTDGSKILFECSPDAADEIIQIFNGDEEIREFEEDDEGC